MSTIEIVCSSRELFGADRAALRLADVLVGLGHRPYLVLPLGRPERGLAAAAGRAGIEWTERPVALATSTGLDSVAGLRPRQTRGGKGPALTVINSISILSGAARGANKVLIVREWLQPRSPKHRVLVAKQRLGLDGVVGISNGVLRQWERSTKGPGCKLVVNDWLDDATISHYAADVLPRAGSILCVGRFNQWKGQEVLADAYDLAFGAETTRPSLTFVGAQAGTEFAPRADAISARGEDGRWSVEPFVPDPSDHFKKAALFVLPSMRPEPFGLVLLEALAAGCMVIAFEGGGPDDLAAAFPDSLRLVKRDTSALAAAIKTWRNEGCQSQSAEQHKATLEVLRTRFSPAAAQSSWASILAAIAPSLARGMS